MSGSISVRLCEADDVPILTQREVHPNAHYAESHFARQQAGHYFFAVAVEDGRPVGSGVLDCRPAALEPELKSLWVYPEARRRGAARALTSFLERVAAREGYDEVFLRVDPLNFAAIPMYISLDYTPTGHHQATSYEYVDPEGVAHTREETDAVFRKSLRLLG